MSLRWRFALGLAVIVAGAIGISGTVAYLSTSRQLHDDLEAFLDERAEPFHASLPRLLESLEQDHDAHPTVSDHGRTYFSPDAVTQLIDPGGRVVFSVPGQPSLPVAAADRRLAAGRRDERLRNVSVEGTDYRMLTEPLPGGGAVQVARDLTETTTELARLRNRLLLIGGIATLGAAAVGWLLARRTARPVERLTATAETIAETRDLASPIDVRGRDEVGRLGSSFNAMVAALRLSREQQRRLVADAGHELRTPLTSLQTNIELLHRGVELNEDDRRRLLDDLLAEVGGLSDLVDELVELATDQAVPDEPAEELRLDELAERVCERTRRRSGRDVTVVVHRSAPVWARPAMIERAIGNLVANAIKFSSEDSPVEVVVDGRTVEVRDHGPGIPEAERDLVFERFYRPAESQNVPGSGLGLAIVKEIVDRHHGTVAVGMADGDGAVVGFTLPTTGEPDTSYTSHPRG
jgi:two-component system, OmpR family, sensor histidine kinase MprB